MPIKQLDLHGCRRHRHPPLTMATQRKRPAHGQRAPTKPTCQPVPVTGRRPAVPPRVSATSSHARLPEPGAALDEHFPCCTRHGRGTGHTPSSVPSPPRDHCSPVTAPARGVSAAIVMHCSGSGARARGTGRRREGRSGPAPGEPRWAGAASRAAPRAPAPAASRAAAPCPPSAARAGCPPAPTDARQLPLRMHAQWVTAAEPHT